MRAIYSLVPVLRTVTVLSRKSRAADAASLRNRRSHDSNEAEGHPIQCALQNDFQEEQCIQSKMDLPSRGKRMGRGQSPWQQWAGRGGGETSVEIAYTLCFPAGAHCHLFYLH